MYRYFIGLTLGVDTLDQKILEDYLYKYDRILCFMGLIDEANIPDTNDNQFDDLRFKVPVINDLIRSLGCTHVFDQTTKYNKKRF